MRKRIELVPTAAVRRPQPKRRAAGPQTVTAARLRPSNAFQRLLAMVERNDERRR
jgi:hypothetical protein